MAKTPSSRTRSKTTHASTVSRKRTTKSTPRRSTASRPGSRSVGRPPTRSSRKRLKWTGLTRDRQLDIIGVIAVLVGLLSLVSMVAPDGELTAWWTQFLVNINGWGAYLLPLILIFLGAWLLFSHLEKLPVLTFERLLGVIFLFLILLTSFSILSLQLTRVHSALVGGGLVGAFFQRLLVNGLGLAAAIIVLFAWLLIGITLALDLSLMDILRFFSPLVRSIREKVKLSYTSWQQERRRRARIKMILPEPVERLPESYQPITNLAHTKTPQQKPIQTPRSVEKSEELQQEKSPLIEPQVVHARKRTPWKLPVPKDMLDPATPAAIQEIADVEVARLIEETLASFGAPSHVVDIKRGPTITQFGVEPDFIETRYGRTRVRVSKITSLADDLALALAAPRIRIQAPVPGKNYVGIEVPNPETSRVTLMEVIDSAAYKRIQAPLRFALGKDVSGKSVAVDLAKLPHLLIAGTTGSGKSVCINSILSSFLFNNTPAELQLVLVDPKRVELTGYNGIPHLLAPVVTEAEAVINALQWMMRQMDSRYHKFSKSGVRNIQEYNERFPDLSLPYLVVVIDELADLMMLAPDETERAITRLAQLARATGIHLVLATQRPSTDVVTGLIKANFPARIAFAVASGVDSRVILDQPGAERLLGRGDMLFQAPDASAPVRLQGVFVSDGEIRRLVEYWQQETDRHSETGAEPAQRIGEDLPPDRLLTQTPLWDEMQEEGDPLYSEAVDLVRREGRASITMLQRRLKVGYTRAARLIDEMEEKGVISGRQPNTQTREVLDYGPTAPPEDNGI